jgi:hypothetical protein
MESYEDTKRRLTILRRQYPLLLYDGVSQFTEDGKARLTEIENEINVIESYLAGL